MVNINKIHTALSGLVGFKQPFNPAYAIVDVDNQKSESGYFATDNPYAKIEFIKDNQDYTDISDSDFNLLLRNIKESSLSNVVNQVFSEYDFLDRAVMFANASNKTETEALPVGFVGYKIEVSKQSNVAFKINRVLLDFQGTGTMKLLLWNTASKETLQSKVVTITSGHQVEELNWTVDNSGATYKGDYYIGYNTQGITVQPYKRQFNNASIMSQIKCLSLSKVAVIGHNSEELFDLQSIDGMSEDCGLNFDISVFEDFTDFAINNKILFARAVQLATIISCIQIYMASLRSNANQQHANEVYEKIMIELEGTRAESVINIKGLKNQLLSEIMSVKAEIAKLKMGFSKKGQIMVSTLN
jgi:hypothetical protein